MTPLVPTLVPTRGPSPFRSTSSLPLLLILVFATGCGDLDPGPLVSLETESTVPSLHLGGELPSVPGLVSRWGGQIPLEELESRWTDSWALPEDEGQRVRSEAVQALVLILEPHLAEEELEGEVGRVRDALEEISFTMNDRELATLEGPVGDATRAGARAGSALAAGDRAAALRWTLESSDHLRRATPEILARTLIRETEEALRTVGEGFGPPSTGRGFGSDPSSELTRARIHRLLQGARDALEGGDPTRALRRAWYAMGLLESSREASDRRGLDDPDDLMRERP